MKQIVYSDKRWHVSQSLLKITGLIELKTKHLNQQISSYNRQIIKFIDFEQSH